MLMQQQAELKNLCSGYGIHDCLITMLQHIALVASTHYT